MKTDYTEEQRYIKAKKRVDAIKGFYTHFLVYVLINVFISGFIIFGLITNEDLSIKQAITHPGVYVTWFGWGIGVLIHWLAVFGFSKLISKDWEERKIKELMQEEENKSQKYL